MQDVLEGPMAPERKSEPEAIVFRLSNIEQVVRLTGGVPLITASSSVWGIAVPTEAGGIYRPDGSLAPYSEVARSGDTIRRSGRGWMVEPK